VARRRPGRERRRSEAEIPADVQALKEIRAELARLSSVIALNVVKDLQQNRQVDFLNKAGFTRGEIAEMVETTPHTVDITLQRARATKKKRKKVAKASA